MGGDQLFGGAERALSVSLRAQKEDAEDEAVFPQHPVREPGVVSIETSVRAREVPFGKRGLRVAHQAKLVAQCVALQRRRLHGCDVGCRHVLRGTRFGGE